MEIDFLVATVATFLSLIPLVNPINAIPLFAVMTTDLTDTERSKLATRAGIYTGAILVVTAIAGVYILEFFGINIAMVQVAGGLIVAQSAWAMVTGNPQVSETETRTWAREKKPTWKRVQRVVARSVQKRDIHEITSHLRPRPKTRPEPPAPKPEEAAADAAAPESDAEEAAADHGSAMTRDIAFSPVAMPLLAGPGAMGVTIGLATGSSSAGDILGLFLGIGLVTLLAIVGLRASSGVLRVLGGSGIIALQRIFGFILLAIAVNLIASGIAALFGLTIYTE